MLYGYGGFNIALTPAIQPVSNLVWMEMGGVFAVREPARRRRIRRSLASGRHEAQEAERLRRFHRRGRMADRGALHVDPQARDPRRQQRRACWSAPA